MVMILFENIFLDFFFSSVLDLEANPSNKVVDTYVIEYRRKLYQLLQFGFYYRVEAMFSS